MRIQTIALAAVTLGSSVLLASCARTAAPALPVTDTSTAKRLPVPLSEAAKQAASKIKHVVVIIQENRSFDNLFQAYPGANTVSIGINSKGKSIPLQAVSLAANYGLDHASKDFFAACDGSPPGQNCKNDAFDKVGVYGAKIPPNPQFGYVPHQESQLYFELAGAYVLGDNMFPSHIDASFVSHQYVIAAQANSSVDLPSGTLWGCGGGSNDTVVTLNQDRTYGPRQVVCFDSTTIADELEAKKMTWHYYAPGVTDPSYFWSPFQAINHIYNGPDWTKDVISPPSQFLTDITDKKLSTVTWISPTCANSDHASCLSYSGPDWVASIVNAVGESKNWNSTAIFVMWDEWGGWYDHVPPPYMDYDGLGFRVPLLVISPYAKQGYISHVQYETGSILRFIEDTFGLAQLAASDSRATSPAGDAFDFTQKPRAFTPFTINESPEQMRKPLPDTRYPDEE
jgi:phospholipase C